MILYDHQLVRLKDTGDHGPNDEAHGWLFNSNVWTRSKAKMEACLEAEDPLDALRGWSTNYAFPYERALGFFSEWKVAPLVDLLRPELEDRSTWKLAGFGVNARPLQYLKHAWRKYGCDTIFDGSPDIKKERFTRQWCHNHKHRILLQTPTATQERLFVTKHVVIVQPSLYPERMADAIARCGDGTATVSVRWIAMDGTIDTPFVEIAMAQTKKILAVEYQC